MFRLILTLIYIIPNIYVYARLNRLFISKGYKITFTVIYLVLFSIYPVSMYFGGDGNSLFSGFLNVISGYLLPFYLYLFLAVLLFDIFLLLNLIFHFFSKEVRKSYRLRMYTLVSMIAVSILVVIGGIINLNNIRVSYYQVSVPKKESHLDFLRVAYASDFHIHRGLSLKYVERFVDMVNDYQPDIMLYGGDIVDDRNVHSQPDKLFELFRKIKPQYGVFGVLGNHEFYRGHTDGEFFKKAGIVLLNDSIVRIDDDFYVAGRYDEHFRNRKTVTELVENLTPDLPLILLDHRPTQLTEVSQTRVDAQFSGHTHNGQLFPINYIIHRLYELSWGYLKKGNTHFFVSSGVRLWGPPVKTAGKSEIMVVDFIFE